MSKPKKVRSLRILGMDYKVKYITNNGVYGACDSITNTILLAKGQHPDQELNTLIHEAIHALDQALKLGLEEHQVHNLGTGVVALMRDNPELIKRLLHGVEEIVCAPQLKQS